MKHIIRSVAGAMLLLGATGLTVAPATAAPTATSWVRAGHLVPGFGEVIVGLTPFDGSKGATMAEGQVPAAPSENGMLAITETAGYGKLGEYRQVPTGVYSITVRPVGAAQSAPPIITGTLRTEAGGATTIAVLGTPKAPQVKTLADDLTPPTAGNARVRLINAAAGSKTIDVSALDGPSLAAGAPFGTATKYGEVPGRGWTVEAKGAGRAASLAGSSKLDIRAGNVYTLLVLGTASQPLRIQPVLDAAGMVAMPEKGAETGLGGTTEQSGNQWMLLAGAGSLLLLGGGIALRRRTGA
ncbi:DUF4397 domain-containing protein [Kribbella sp. NPDC056861]|uniref:DUF4397 domain-containing protein n=1 Tax=Kribbella sp. NPDC056861 TaxID=3154857 RepID=UPI00342E0660